MGDSGDEFRQQERRRRRRQQQARPGRPGAGGGGGGGGGAALGAEGAEGRSSSPGSAAGGGPPLRGGGPVGTSGGAVRGAALPPTPLSLPAPGAGGPSRSLSPPPGGPPRGGEEGEEEEEEGAGRLPCQLCREDLSALDPRRRQRHVNECLDERERLRRRPAAGAPGPPPPAPECPVCGKSFGSLRGRAGHLRRCADGTGVSSELLVRRVASQEPPRGPKRRGSASVAPLAKKPRGASGVDEDLLVALAMSRSLLEEEKARAKRLREELSRRKGPRAEKRWRLRAPRSPPLLLLQDPGKARQEMEARAALLLFPEAGEFPSTPPLPASHLLDAQQSEGSPPCLPGSLWELSSLTGGSLPGNCSAAGLSLLSLFPEQRFGLVASLPVRPPGMDRVTSEPPGSPCGPSRSQSGEVGGTQQGVEGTLQDLVELAEEGLTLTQWNLDVRQWEGPGEEWAAPGDAPQKVPVCLKEEDKEKSLGSSCHTLSSLAADFGKMVNNPHLSDVQFQVDSGEIFYAHLFVLYARCPQLLEVVDQTGFTVAEEGGPGTRRVLLNDVLGEAVGAFLKYLYMADSCIPRHLRADVAILATRFRVWDLAALCGTCCGLRVSGETENGSGSCDDGGGGGVEDNAEAFEELLESVWLDEDKEAPGKLPHQERNSSEAVGEEELEEIYEFAATQRLFAARARRGEEEEEEEGYSKGKQSHEGKWEGLEDPAAAALGTSAGLETLTFPCLLRASQEGGPQRVPLEQLQGAEERRSGQLRQAFDDCKEASVQDGRLETLASLAGGRGCSLEPSGIRSCAATRKSLQPVWKVVPREHSLELAGLPGKSVLLSSPQQRAAWPRSHPLRAYDLSSSPSLPGPTKMGSSQTVPEVPCIGQGQPLCGKRPLSENPDGGPVVVLDSDEEGEVRTSVGGPGISGQNLGVSSCQGPSPPLQWGFGEGDGREAGLLWRLTCSLGKSEEQLQLSSSDEEEGVDKGGKTLVPDTPLPRKPTQGIMPGPEGQQRKEESSVRSFLEKPSPRDPLPIACVPLPSPTRWPGSGVWSSTPCLQDEVVVVEDSEEEESLMEESAPVWQRAVGTAAVSEGASGQQGSRPQSMEAEGGCPLAAGGLVPGSEGTAAAWPEGRGWTGGARDDSDGSDILPLTQRSPPPPAASAQRTPELPACQLQEGLLPMTPLTPMPSYSVMATPELKKELKRFGVRALPKRQMVLKLKEIFQFTHPGRGTESTGRAPWHHPAQTLQESQQTVCSRDLCRGVAQGAELYGFPGGSEQSKCGTDLPAAGLALGCIAGDGSPPFSLPASQESTGSSVAGSESSALSHSSTEFETGLLVAEEAVEALVPVSQAATCEESKLEAFRHYIHSTPALCRQILLYQPIELTVLQAELKQNGIRIALGKLLDLLDTHCITFTTAEARREKHQHSQQTRRQERRQRRC